MKPLLTPFGLVIGKLAIKLAEENGLLLNADESNLGAARDDVSPDEARRKYVGVNEKLIWLMME
jgi:hypothetical protein